MASYQPAPIGPALAEAPEPEVMGAAAWMGGGFVLPIASPDFYRFGARRKIGPVIGFFVLFNVLVSLIAAVHIGYTMTAVRASIWQAFSSGQFPEITISGGLASVDAPQPVVLMDRDRMLVVIDTTGRTVQPDSRRYNSGFVLTRDSLLTLNNGQYQQIPLSQIQEAFQQDPIVINAEMVTRLWDRLTTWLTVGAFILGMLWKVLVGIVWMMFLAWILRGVATLFTKKVEFTPVLIAGIYALVPATYLVYLLGRVNVRFFLMPTLILLVIWGIALVPALRRRLPGEVETTNLEPWQMWVGVPMLLVFAWDAVMMQPDAVALAFIIAVVTLLLYVAMPMFLGSRPIQEEQTGD